MPTDPKTDLAAYLSHLKEQLRKMDVNPEELKSAGPGKPPKKKAVVLSTVQEGNAADNPQRGSLLRSTMLSPRKLSDVIAVLQVGLLLGHRGDAAWGLAIVAVDRDVVQGESPA